MKKFTLFVFYLVIYLIGDKSSTCNCQSIVRYFRSITLNNMTHVNPSANTFYMSTNTLDEIMAP
jgi:hypothetical protein